MTTFELPMFPIGSVLFPSAPLPLRLFEPRYLAMISDVLDTDSGFGVVLIERGSEVGGGEVRTSVGTHARVVQADQAADGTWRVMAAGLGRIKVVEWLDDDPYPRALVRELVDVDTGIDDVDPRWLELDMAFRDIVGTIAAHRGASTPPSIELAPSPALATFQMAAILPINPLDRQRILAAPSAEARRVVLLECFEDLRLLVSGDGNH